MRCQPALGVSQPNVNRLSLYQQYLMQPPKHESFSLTSQWQSNMSQRSYSEKFAAIEEYLKSGDCYQINLAQRFRMSNKRLLFIPVSSPEGIGEYMRSLQLAHTLTSEYGNSLDIHFILNKHTAYAKNCPFPTLLLNQSATKCGV